MTDDLNLTTVSSLVERAREVSREDGRRPHLGCSLLGHHCDRWLWLSFRWAVVELHEGRILGVFRRGHCEEPLVYSDLRAAGLTVSGEQDRVAFSAHVSGSTDGRILGVPAAEKTEHVLEIKTHSRKSFDDVSNRGVREAKPMHWAQMQLYMHGLRLTRALYYAVCKDDDRIYTERVHYDREAAEALVARGLRITTSHRMPEPCPGASPTWYQCKFCPAYHLCHAGMALEQQNCRTCQQSTPTEAGWKCERWGAEIPLEAQKTGCEHWEIHEDFCPF